MANAKLPKRPGFALLHLTPRANFQGLNQFEGQFEGQFKGRIQRG